VSRTPHILLVEDDPEIARMLVRFLGQNEMRVTAVTNGRAMFRAFDDGQIDLVLLDLMLPGEGGLALCARLRADSRVPVVIVTAKGDEVDRIVGLEIGADDYVAKPFNPRELLARIRAVLRRTAAVAGTDASSGRVFGFAGWQVDTAQRLVTNPEGVRVMLTSAEFDLLSVFCERPRRVLSRDQLLDLTHGRAGGPFDRSIDVLVSRLRQKIERVPKEPGFIQTVRNAGYLFSPEVRVQ
jgi:two-component system OmpR family response regulator